MTQFLILSSLAKVFSDEKPSDKNFSSFSMLKNERSSFQLAVCSSEDTDLSIDITGWNSENVSMFIVREIPSDLPAYDDSDDYFIKKTPGMYPDLLEPVSGNIALTGGKWYSIWFELDSSGVAAGLHKITVSANDGKGNTFSDSIHVEIIDAALPEQSLICTFWFHCDCLATYYNVEVFSEEHWRIIENYVKNAVRHGVNFILYPTS